MLCMPRKGDSGSPPEWTYIDRVPGKVTPLPLWSQLPPLILALCPSPVGLIPGPLKLAYDADSENREPQRSSWEPEFLPESKYCGPELAPNLHSSSRSQGILAMIGRRGKSYLVKFLLLSLWTYWNQFFTCCILDIPLISIILQMFNILGSRSIPFICVDCHSPLGVRGVSS